MSGILVVNTGSSSVKFGLYEDDRQLLRGQIRSFPEAPELVVNGERTPSPATQTVSDAISLVSRLIEKRFPELLVAAVAHRVVHGGSWAEGPVVIDDAVLDRIRMLIPLAPSHQPGAILGIEAARTVWPGARQVAGFDTSFHRSQARSAQIYALPRAMTEDGIIRYGFHGLSYDYLAGAVAERLGSDDARVVAAHLGSGASLCAIRGRKSVATTMGLTALDGLPMATRCGDLDPGAVLYLLREKGWQADALEETLYEEAGLRGISGLSGDMAELLSRRDDPRAQEAVEHFCHRVRLGIGEMAAALGGLDALVFAGGIGENAAPVRARVAHGLGFLGIAVDDTKNEAHAEDITARGGACRVFALRTNEEEILRRGAAGILGS